MATVALDSPPPIVARQSLIKKAAYATVGVVIALVPVALIVGTRHTIVVFAVAILLAYMLLPAVEWIEHRLPPRWPRGITLGIIYIILLGFIGSILGVVVSRAVQEGAGLVGKLPALTREQSWVDRLPLPTWLGPLRNKAIDGLHDLLDNGGKQVLPYVETVAEAIAIRSGSALYLILIPILSFFFLKDGAEIRASLLNLVGSEKRRNRIDESLTDAHSVLGKYIRALVTLSAATFVSYTAFLSAIRVPYAFLLAFVAAFLEFVPVVGPLSGGGILVVVGALTGSPHVLWIVIFWAVYRIFQDYVLSPYLMSSGVEVHPLLVLFGVLGGEELAGIPGMVFSVPLIAIAGVLLRAVVSNRTPRLDAQKPVGSLEQV